MSAANYIVMGKWSQCAHCFNLYTAEHYCGAPWQSPPTKPFPDGASPEMIANVGKRLTPPSTGRSPE